MTCMIAPLPGGTPEIWPLAAADMLQLRDNGKDTARSMGFVDADFVDREFLGAANRADGSPFYLWITAPKLEDGQSNPWKGAFYAPFGVGYVWGFVDVVPGVKESDMFAISTLDVDAKLIVRGNEQVAASWRVIGSQLSEPNKAALIDTIQITNSGPHNSDDIRRCIALHAPQRALGEPNALVSMQCGVAVAALVEAIC